VNEILMEYIFGAGRIDEGELEILMNCWDLLRLNVMFLPFTSAMGKLINN
jgi:hypothetical protein